MAFFKKLSADLLGANEDANRDWEKEKEQLERNLSDVLKRLQKEAAAHPHEPVKSGHHVQRLCNALEHIFRHGLISTFVFNSSASFWPVACRISRKDAIQYIKSLQYAKKSDHARARAWIRLAINEHSLESYMTVLTQDIFLLREYYERDAFMMDAERSAILKSLLAGMSFTMSFDLTVDDIGLDYEPTPTAQARDSILVANPPAVAAAEERSTPPAQEPVATLAEELQDTPTAVAVTRVVKKKKKKKKKTQDSEHPSAQDVMASTNDEDFKHLARPEGTNLDLETPTPDVPGVASDVTPEARGLTEEKDDVPAVAAAVPAAVYHPEPPAIAALTQQAALNPGSRSPVADDAGADDGDNDEESPAVSDSGADDQSEENAAAGPNRDSLNADYTALFGTYIGHESPLTGRKGMPDAASLPNADGQDDDDNHGDGDNYDDDDNDDEDRDGDGRDRALSATADYFAESTPPDREVVEEAGFDDAEDSHEPVEGTVERAVGDDSLASGDEADVSGGLDEVSHVEERTQPMQPEVKQLEQRDDGSGQTESNAIELNHDRQSSQPQKQSSQDTGEPQQAFLPNQEAVDSQDHIASPEGLPDREEQEQEQEQEQQEEEEHKQAEQEQEQEQQHEQVQAHEQEQGQQRDERQGQAPALHTDTAAADHEQQASMAEPAPQQPPDPEPEHKPAPQQPPQPHPLPEPEDAGLAHDASAGWRTVAEPSSAAGAAPQSEPVAVQLPSSSGGKVSVSLELGTPKAALSDNTTSPAGGAHYLEVAPAKDVNQAQYLEVEPAVSSSHLSQAPPQTSEPPRAAGASSKAAASSLASPPGTAAAPRMLSPGLNSSVLTMGEFELQSEDDTGADSEGEQSVMLRRSPQSTRSPLHQQEKRQSAFSRAMKHGQGQGQGQQSHPFAGGPADGTVQQLPPGPMLNIHAASAETGHMRHMVFNAFGSQAPQTQRQPAQQQHQQHHQHRHKSPRQHQMHRPPQQTQQPLSSTPTDSGGTVQVRQGFGNPTQPHPVAAGSFGAGGGAMGADVGSVGRSVPRNASGPGRSWQQRQPMRKGHPHPQTAQDARQRGRSSSPSAASPRSVSPDSNLEQLALRKRPKASTDFVGSFVLVDDYFEEDGVPSLNSTHDSFLAPLPESIDELRDEIAAREERIKQGMANSNDGNTTADIQEIVDLKMRLQHAKEILTTANDDDSQYGGVTIQREGHDFRPMQLPASSSALCDVCKRQLKSFTLIAKTATRYSCAGCKIIIHKHCLEKVTRTCVVNKFSAAKLNLDVCPNMGLDAQDYKCAECNTISIGFQEKEGMFAEARQCDYTGKYYCPTCHEQDVCVIPARVIHNWDFRPYPVSIMSRELLRVMNDKPVIDIMTANAKLFSHVEELKEIRRIRGVLRKMQPFLATCRVATKDAGELVSLKKRRHFLESHDLFALQDLLDLQNGELLPALEKARDFAEHHIRESCELCRAKGFICEVCQSNSIIYPFDYDVTSCSQCLAVFHTQCFATLDTCPRCDRKARRKGSISSRASLPE